MSNVAQLAPQRNRKSQSWPSAEYIWSKDHQINSREIVRVELRQERTHTVVDIRRWFRQPDGTTRATGKGFAISCRRSLTSSVPGRDAGHRKQRAAAGGDANAISQWGCRMTAATGQLHFLDAVDIAYEAALWSGLVKTVGDDIVQGVLSAAFANPRRPS
jgi:hypothetical protein